MERRAGSLRTSPGASPAAWLWRAMCAGWNGCVWRRTYSRVCQHLSRPGCGRAVSVHAPASGPACSWGAWWAGPWGLKGPRPSGLQHGLWILPRRMVTRPWGSILRGSILQESLGAMPALAPCCVPRRSLPDLLAGLTLPQLLDALSCPNYTRGQLGGGCVIEADGPKKSGSHLEGSPSHACPAPALVPMAAPCSQR